MSGRWIARLTLPLLALALPGAGAGSGGDSFSVTEVADGIYVHRGAHEEASAANRNDIANIGFVVGDDCVAVIDTGGSPPIGRQLRRAVEAHTDMPVCYVINTHVHPDHLLGNVAFTGDGVQVVAHHDLERALATRAETYLSRLETVLDTEPSRDWLVPPDRTIADTASLDLGGRELRLWAWPTAHTDNDLTVLDRTTGTLFAGDLVFMQRVPALDGSINGWLSALEELAACDGVQRIVPGHGPPSASCPGATTDIRRYLETVRRGVRRTIDDGRTMEHAVAEVGRDEQDRWTLFDDYHRRNVTAAFAELEWE